MWTRIIHGDSHLQIQHKPKKKISKVQVLEGLLELFIAFTRISLSLIFLPHSNFSPFLISMCKYIFFHNDDESQIFHWDNNLCLKNKWS